MHHSLFEKFEYELCEGILIDIFNFNVQDCNKNYNKMIKTILKQHIQKKILKLE